VAGNTPNHRNCPPTTKNMLALPVDSKKAVLTKNSGVGYFFVLQLVVVCANKRKNHKKIITAMIH
jgi:hypothetical protein